MKNKQQFNDDSHRAENLGINSTLWPIFGVVWDSSQILAHHMSTIDIAGKKILEVGCGLGITSLVLNERSADITSTDYHPEAELFLKENTKLNGAKDIPFFLANWADKNNRVEKYNLIIGSDVLYEAGHEVLLSKFIESNAAADCDVIIVDPGRSYLNKFTKNMKELGYTYSQEKPKDQSFLEKYFKGTINHYTRRR